MGEARSLMLVGGIPHPNYPPPPDESDGLAAVIRYLYDFRESVTRDFEALTNSTIGVLGVRGLSSTGTMPQNFVGSLAIGNTTNPVFSLINIEPDVSYLVYYSMNTTTGIVLTGITQSTTGINLTFDPVVPSGLLMNILLLR